MPYRRPLSLPRLAPSGHPAFARPWRPSVAARPSCTPAQQTASLLTQRLLARRRHGDSGPGFDPWAQRPVTRQLGRLLYRSAPGQALAQCAHRLTALRPGSELTRLLLVALIRCTALLIAVGLHGLLAFVALG